MAANSRLIPSNVGLVPELLQGLSYPAILSGKGTRTAMVRGAERATPWGQDPMEPVSHDT